MSKKAPGLFWVQTESELAAKAAHHTPVRSFH